MMERSQSRSDQDRDGSMKVDIAREAPWDVLLVLLLLLLPLLLLLSLSSDWIVLMLVLVR